MIIPTLAQAKAGVALMNVLLCLQMQSYFVLRILIVGTLQPVMVVKQDVPGKTTKKIQFLVMVVVR